MSDNDIEEIIHKDDKIGDIDNNGNPMIELKSWDDFRDAGLLMFTNQILHAFGYAIVVEINDDGKVTHAQPARVKYRGFSEESVSRNYIKLNKFLMENAEKLYEESLD